MQFEINEKLPSLNEYQKACRTNKYAGAKFKESVEDKIKEHIILARHQKKLKPVEIYPVEISFEWHEATKKRDVDNIQSAQKFILDALQKSGILKNDSRKYVSQIYHTVIDGNEDKVVVHIAPREREEEE